ncbi:MAG: chromate transporter [Lentisphaeria bacterium]
MSKSQKCFILFYEFFKIATFVVGGGYAIIPAAEDVFVKRRKWLKEEEMLDLIVVAQTVPGIIACNSAIYIGLKTAGIFGGICAAFGCIIPSIIIILIIASLLNAYPINHPAIIGAFSAIQAAVAGLMIATAWKMRKNALASKFATFIATSAIIIGLLKVNPIYIMIAAMPLGIIYTLFLELKIKKDKP